MNREIKFRVWDYKRKRMYLPVCVFMETPTNGGLWATVKGFDVIEQKEIHLQSEKCNIMQFTGLIDRLEIEIYEGDIVYCRDEHGYVVGRNDVVEYNSLTGCFWLRYRDIPLYKWAMFYNDNGTIDVIGNIHENQELLK